MAKSGWLAAGLWLMLAALAVAGERVWTDVEGREVRGEFVREVDGEVMLLANGKLVTLPLDKLSDRDRQFVRDLAAGKAAPVEGPAKAVPVKAPPPAALDSQAAATTAISPPSEPATTESEKEKLPKALQKQAQIVNRVWTDLQGNQVTAKFVRIFGSNVVLLRGTKTVTVRYYDLTSEDQEYVKELLTSQGKAAEIPPVLPVPRDPAAAAAPPAPSAPSPPEPPSPPPPEPIGGGPSSSFEEMRQRQEKLREESQQRLEQLRQESATRATEMQQQQERLRQEREEAIRNRPVAQCTKCKKMLTKDQTELGTCPHCGVAWQYEVDRFGNKRRLSPRSVASLVAADGSSSSTDTSADGGSPANSIFADMSGESRQAVIIGIIVVGVLALVGIVIYIAFSMASANTVSRQRRYF